MSKHTPGRLKIKGESFGHYISIGTDTKVVCRVPWGKGSAPTDGGDAEHIVRCWNSHDVLKEALTGLYSEVLALIEEGTLPREALYHPKMCAAHSALTQAGA